MRPALSRSRCRQGADPGSGRDGRARQLDQTGIVSDCDLRSSSRCSTASRSKSCTGSSTARPGAFVNGRSKASCARMCSGPGSISDSRTGTATEQADHDPCRPQGHEDPQLRRRRHSLAHPASSARSRTPRLAQRAAGAVARHVRRAGLDRTKACVSAKLWDSGVKYSWRITSSSAEYMPMVSQAFWDKLAPDQQKMMTDSVGAEHRRPTVPTWRPPRPRRARRWRRTASSSPIRRAAKRRGARKRMMAEQDTVAKDIKISPEMVKLITAEASAGSA